MADANARDTWSSAGDVLREVLDRDPSVLTDAELLRNHLLDRIPERKADINLLVTALTEGIPGRLTNASPVPIDALVTELRGALARDHGLTSDRADWAVRAWAHALRRGEAPRRAVPESTASAASASKSSLPIGAIVGGVIVLAALVFAWQRMRGPLYTMDRLSVFYSDRPLSQDVGELQNYNAWCDAGAELVTKGPQPWPCAIVVPFPATTPRIKVEIFTSYRGGSASEIPFACDLTDAGGRVAADATAKGELPATSKMKVLWLTAFERPSLGWTPGRYHVSCKTADASIQAWLDIKSDQR